MGSVVSTCRGFEGYRSISNYFLQPINEDPENAHVYFKMNSEGNISIRGEKLQDLPSPQKVEKGLPPLLYYCGFPLEKDYKQYDETVIPGTYFDHIPRCGPFGESKMVLCAACQEVSRNPDDPACSIERLGKKLHPLLWHELFPAGHQIMSGYDAPDRRVILLSPEEVDQLFGIAPDAPNLSVAKVLPNTFFLPVPGMVCVRDVGVVEPEQWSQRAVVCGIKTLLKSRWPRHPWVRNCVPSDLDREKLDEKLISSLTQNDSSFSSNLMLCFRNIEGNLTFLNDETGIAYCERVKGEEVTRATTPICYGVTGPCRACWLATHQHKEYSNCKPVIWRGSNHATAKQLCKSPATLMALQQRSEVFVWNEDPRGLRAFTKETQWKANFVFFILRKYMLAYEPIHMPVELVLIILSYAVEVPPEEEISFYMKWHDYPFWKKTIE